MKKKIQEKDTKKLKDSRRNSKGREKTENSRIEMKKSSIIVLQSYSTSQHRFKSKGKLRTESIRLHAFSEFTMSSCKWGEAVSLQCKHYKFGPLV